MHSSHSICTKNGFRQIASNTLFDYSNCISVEWISTSKGVKVIQGRESDAAVDSVFPYIATIQKIAKCCRNKAALTTVPKLYSVVVNQILFK